MFIVCVLSVLVIVIVSSTLASSFAVKRKQMCKSSLPLGINTELGTDVGSEGTAAFIDWEPVNSRVIISKFTFKKIATRLYYAPTNDEEDKKDYFYQQLQP